MYQLRHMNIFLLIFFLLFFTWIYRISLKQGHRENQKGFLRQSSTALLDTKWSLHLSSKSEPSSVKCGRTDLLDFPTMQNEWLRSTTNYLGLLTFGFFSDNFLTTEKKITFKNVVKIKSTIQMRHWVGSICNRLKSSDTFFVYVLVWVFFWFWPSSSISSSKFSLWHPSHPFGWLRNRLTLTRFSCFSMNVYSLVAFWDDSSKSRKQGLKTDAINSCFTVSPRENQSQSHWKSKKMASSKDN